MESFKKSKINEAILEQFEKIYREAYAEGWNDALVKVQELLPKKEGNEK